MKKFLIADDDADDVEIFKEALQKVDPLITCYTATNGKEVLEKLNSREFPQPNIIFLYKHAGDGRLGMSCGTENR